MPFPALRHKAKDGDLFLLHLITEGKPVFDPSDLFSIIRSDFLYKDTYRKEKIQASMIISLLADSDYLESRTVRKRYVWGLRTLLIATAAEARIPIFGSAQLAKWSGISDLKEVIDRRNVISTETLVKAGADALQRFGRSLKKLDWPNESRAKAEAMVEMGGICKSTVQLIYPDMGVNTKRAARNEYF